MSHPYILYDPDTVKDNDLIDKEELDLPKRPEVINEHEVHENTKIELSDNRY